ncbi:MAG: AAA family ATPase, partial [Candidatus Thiodiazotropha taylori]
MSSIEKAIERLEKSKAEKKSVDRSAVEVEPEKTATPEAAPSETVAASQPVEEKVSAAAEEKASPAVEETVNESIEEAKRINLDYEALSSNGFIVPHSGNKQLSEEYRIIKRPLIRNALGKGAAPITHGNLVSIASSLPSEGKTFTAMNLALSIATELDTTVLLIDGDVLKYSLSRLLGIQNEPGLIDLLSQKECNVSDVIIHTQIPRLKLIAAGHRSEKSTELLASKEMERLLDELSNRYSDRIIIFDSSPILATSEAAV